MPIVAIINGIKVELYFDEHPPPHFHCRYAEFIAQIDIETIEVIKGTLPIPQLRSVREWASSRRDKLKDAWNACASGKVPGRIE